MKTNWQTKKVEEICEVEYGTRVVQKRNGGSIYPVYGGGGATFFMDIYNRESRVVIARFAMSEKCTRFVEGKFFLNDSGMTITSKNLNLLDQKYLDWLIISLNKKIYSLGRGSAQKNLNVDSFRNIEIPLPPLSEQKRIVKILDEVFEKLEKVKVETEKNLASVKELFESYLQNVFKNPGKDWEEKKLGEILKLEYGKPLDKKDRNINGLYSVYGANGEKAKSNKFFYDKPSIIIGRKGSAGELKIVKEKFWPLDVTYFITFNDKNYDLFFLYFILKKLELPKLARGVKPGINRNDVYSIKINIPKSITEQKEIVKKLDGLSEKVKKLENIYEEKLKNLDELKKSILEKAFQGEL